MAFIKDDEVRNKSNVPLQLGYFLVLPIVEDKKVVGFVSESTIVKIVDKAFEHGGALIDEAKIKDVAYDKPYGDASDIYSYVTRKVTVYEIEDMFNDAIKHIPAFVEALCIQQYFEAEGVLPKWNIEL